MSRPAYLIVADTYTRHIEDGVLAPGTQLPSYAEIAQSYQVSDIVVRRAIEILKSRGLVRSVPRRGIFVAGPLDLNRASEDIEADQPSKQRTADMDRDSSQELAALRREVARMRTEIGLLLDHFGIDHRSDDPADSADDA